MHEKPLPDFWVLRNTLRDTATSLQFSALGFAKAAIPLSDQQGLKNYLSEQRHGGMDYMARHADLRLDPTKLLPGAQSIILVTLPYSPPNVFEEQNGISCYAQGRDYHGVMRQRLKKLAAVLQTADGVFPENACRVFCDTAPVMEVSLTAESGVGWRGKNTLLLTKKGSYHFLGGILSTLPLADEHQNQNSEHKTKHCGTCTACLTACPTKAFVAPYALDARRCISYLTIEHQGEIPLELRPLIGTHIYGCDDCQSVCPWNRFAKKGDAAFMGRDIGSAADFPAWFLWSEAEFLQKLEGSPIRRIGHRRWLRNLAIAIGNAGFEGKIPRSLAKQVLSERQNDDDLLVKEHTRWALLTRLSG